MPSTLYVLAVLCLIVVISEVLVRRTWMRHLGTALVVILVTAVAVNVGILPTGRRARRARPTPRRSTVGITTAPAPAAETAGAYP